MGILLDGKGLAEERRVALSTRVATFIEKHGRGPCLSVVLVGDDSASALYVRNKVRMAERVGMLSRVERLAADASQEEVLSTVEELNGSADVDGLIVQLPLPEGLDPEEIIASISPSKDVDGLTPVNLGRIVRGLAGPRPCTPKGVLALLKHYGINCAGKQAVVVGRSALVGKPMALMLVQEDATVTLCHSKTRDLNRILKDADIVVAAIGRPAFLDPESFKPGVVIVDVGISRVNDLWVGDVSKQGLSEVASAWTPVPGGVGPMTITMLLFNTILSAKRSVGFD